MRGRRVGLGYTTGTESHGQMMSAKMAPSAGLPTGNLEFTTRPLINLSHGDMEMPIETSSGGLEMSWAARFQSKTVGAFSK